jgi:ATP-dependent Clp protease ATP-binding subunit ClpA
MPPLLQDFERTCARAHAIAAERRTRPSGEDFLLALIDDPHAAAVMDACALDRDKLRSARAARAGQARGAVPSIGFLPILQGATAHLQASGRNADLSGAEALAAIVRGSAPQLAETLRRHGLTRFDALRFIAHGLRKGEELRDEEAAATAPTLAVKLLNDDYTPMEFVVWALERVFDHGRETAARIML